MCGIVGMASWGRGVDRAALERATRSLAHRGPDGEGVWVSGDGRCGLGHRRLSLIDLEGGHQPILSETGELAISANGELYDHERIAEGLVARGHTFKTRSDSEIALHLYEDLGADCLELLRGEFALVIWDGRRGELFAARDRFGIKPLFWAERGGQVWVASEIKALLQAGVPARWDARGVYEGMHMLTGQDRTLFEGVRQVPPGHYLKARGGRVEVVRYWDAELPRRPDVGETSDVALMDEVGRGLEEAIRLRLRADVELGCYLSGGVDSSSVLGMAAKRLGRPLKAFTVCFEHADFNEHSVASEQAAHVGCDYHPIRVTNQEFAQVFEDSVAACEGLQINGHAPARYILSREVRRAGIKAVLGGEGADELFLGYHFAQAALGRSMGGVSVGQVARGVGAVAGRLLTRPSEAERYVGQVSQAAAWLTRLVGFPPELMDGLVGRYRGLRGLLREEFLAGFAGEDLGQNFLSQFHWREQVWGREPARQIIYLWMKSAFPGYVLAAERMDMAHAVELRLPFLDHRLFEAMARIPARRIAPEAQNKWLLRQTVRPYVTRAVYEGKKQPFFAPPSSLYEGNAQTAQIFDLLTSSSASDVPFLNGRALARFVDEVRRMEPEARAAMDPVLYMMASAVILHRRYAMER